MIRLEIGTKSAFFFCDSISLSRKSKPTLSLELSEVTAKLAKGILRGIGSEAVICVEGLEYLQQEAETKSTKVVEPEVPSVIESEKQEEITPEAAAVVTTEETVEAKLEEAVPQEEAKKVTKPRTKKVVETKDPE